MAVRVLDRPGRIVELVWTGRETPDDIQEANRQLKSVVEQIGAPFDLLVDMRTVVAWSQETKAAVVEHQRLLLGWGMRRASVVVGSAITKMQLNGVKKASQNDKEFQWLTYEEALEFLRGPV